MAIAGATVVVLGMLYLVALAIANRWITPQTQWAGELTLCGLLAAIGVWKANEREGFGQILTGTGLCGAYLSFAGAHVAKGLIGQEAMVGSFVLLSLAAIGVGVWRESKPFFVFGVLGGFLAACLPLSEGRPTVALAIHGAVLLPGVVIVARRRWLDMAYVLWTVSLAFGFWGLAALSRGGLAAALATDTQVWRHWAATVGLSLAATFAYIWAFRVTETERAPQLAWAAPTLTIGAGLIGAPVLWDWPGWWAVTVASGLFWLLGQTSATVQARDGLRTGAVIAAVFLPWVTVTAHQASFAFAVECLAFAVFASVRGHLPSARLSVWLGMASALAGLPALVQMSSGDFALGVPRVVADSLTGLLLCAAAVALCRVPWLESGRESVHQALGVAGVSALARAVMPLLVLGRVQVDVAMAWSWTVPALVLPFVLLRTRSGTVGVAMGLSVVLALACSWLAALSVRVFPGQEIALGFALVAALVLYMAALFRVLPQAVSQFAALTSIAAVYPFGRAVYLWATGIGADRATGIVLGFGLFSVACALLSRIERLRELSVAGAAYGTLAAVPYALLLDPEAKLWLGWAQGSAIVSSLTMMAGIAAVTFAFVSNGGERKETSLAVGAALFGLPLGRLVHVLCVSSGLQAFQAALLFCALYAALLALAGSTKRWIALSVAAALYLAAGLAIYPAMKTPEWATLLPSLRPVGWRSDLVALASLLASSLLVGRSLLLNGAQRTTTLTAFSLLNWPLVAGALMVLAQQPPLTLRFDASMSAAWVVYGTALLVAGFIRSEPVLRSMGLVVFAATLGKVFLYDLVLLEPAIKVVLLLGFGLVMLALSYAYIRASRRNGSGGEG